MDLNSLVVALDDKWAAEHELPISVFRFPWDPEVKGMYFLKVYHGLHCLVSFFPTAKVIIFTHGAEKSA